jgi:hypothetical protein
MQQVGVAVTLQTCIAEVHLTSRSRAFPEKPIVAQLVKKYPTFYGTRGFFTVFKIALH